MVAVLSDCAASISEEQLTQWAGRVPEGEWMFGEQRSGKVSEVGVVVLGDGQKVSFCFVSHHQGLPCLDWNCVDSLAICRVGIWRSGPSAAVVANSGNLTGKNDDPRTSLILSVFSRDVARWRLRIAKPRCLSTLTLHHSVTGSSVEKSGES